ncbi:hypothetical protein HELRODRAFT_191638 [Helobdella robusta]|uniref:Uncharacterized protein n=1 Tax=Helobdella robusta TaxID=6412 RepID=T1FT57_HELRO|nr:hypothetical protein HELRODRAFT_191638 [Helobdella robusta]ESO04592.1 hypothetical protein HELRODRAFT_191638 [Helobdella robusta]
MINSIKSRGKIKSKKKIGDVDVVDKAPVPTAARIGSQQINMLNQQHITPSTTSSSSSSFHNVAPLPLSTTASIILYTTTSNLYTTTTTTSSKTTTTSATTTTTIITATTTITAAAAAAKQHVDRSSRSMIRRGFVVNESKTEKIICFDKLSMSNNSSPIDAAVSRSLTSLPNTIATTTTTASDTSAAAAATAFVDETPTETMTEATSPLSLGSCSSSSTGSLFRNFLDDITPPSQECKKAIVKKHSIEMTTLLQQQSSSSSSSAAATNDVMFGSSGCGAGSSNGGGHGNSSGMSGNNSNLVNSRRRHQSSGSVEGISTREPCCNIYSNNDSNDDDDDDDDVIYQQAATQQQRKQRKQQRQQQQQREQQQQQQLHDYSCLLELQQQNAVISGHVTPPSSSGFNYDTEHGGRHKRCSYLALFNSPNLESLDGWTVPSLRPLETLHNALTLKQVEKFIKSVTELSEKSDDVTEGDGGSNGGGGGSSGRLEGGGGNWGLREQESLQSSSESKLSLKSVDDASAFCFDRSYYCSSMEACFNPPTYRPYTPTKPPLTAATAVSTAAASSSSSSSSPIKYIPVDELKLDASLNHY